MAERVQKVLAQLGYGSRRKIEAWMREGRVVVNGRPAMPGDSLSPDDVVLVDGKRVALEPAVAPASRVILYHKPAGEICTRSDPEGRPSIYRNLPALSNARWVAVGRLDVSTTGLILLTTDGELANRLMHPSSAIEREYLVRVLGDPGPEVIERLRQGVELEDGPASFSTVYEIGGRGANHWFGVVLKEGRKREVRRMWEAAGFKVSRLKRIRFGPVALPARVRQGRFEELDAAAIRQLRQACGLITAVSRPPTPASTPARPRIGKQAGPTGAATRRRSR